MSEVRSIDRIEFTGEVHPAARLFPLLDGVELEELAKDIAHGGLIEPLWLMSDGTLLDGRNRLAACELASVEPRWRVYGGDDPVGFVVSQNVHRRHMSQGQLAMVAVELEPLFAEQAKKRQRASGGGEGRRGGDRRSVVTDASQPIQPADGRKARAQAAQAVGVGGSTVGQAKKVAADAPELANKVRKGEISLNHAAAKTDARQETAKADKVGRLVKKGASDKAIAEMLGLSLNSVSQTRRALGLDPAGGVSSSSTLKPGPRPKLKNQRKRFAQAWATAVCSVHLADGIDIPDDLRSDELDPLLADITKARSALNALKKRLKRSTQ